MARTAPLTIICALTACGYVAFHVASAFVPGPAAKTPSLRGEAAAAVMAGALGLSDPAGAFVYEGKDYFDTTLGYGPLPWAVAAITILAFASALLRSVRKYQPTGPIMPGKTTDVASYLNQSERASKGPFPWDRTRAAAIKAAAAKNGTGGQR
jgi:hypothetical protein